MTRLFSCFLPCLFRSIIIIRTRQYVPTLCLCMLDQLIQSYRRRWHKLSGGKLDKKVKNIVRCQARFFLHLTADIADNRCRIAISVQHGITGAPQVRKDKHEEILRQENTLPVDNLSQNNSGRPYYKIKQACIKQS